MLDLPGTYSLEAMGPDEIITRDICLGRRPGETMPDLIVCVADATNLRLHLRFVLEVKRLGRPMILALNMMDAAKKRGIMIDTARLEAGLGIKVIETIAVKAEGTAALVAHLMWRHMCLRSKRRATFIRTSAVFSMPRWSCRSAPR